MPPSSCSTSWARFPGPTWTSRDRRRSTRSAATTRGAAPARASACSRNGSGAAARPLLRRGLRPPRRVEDASVCRSKSPLSHLPWLGLTGEQGGDRRLAWSAAQLHPPARQADVDLAADSETAGEIDARLDREAGLGEVAAQVAGLEVVVVHAVAVPVVIDAVPEEVDARQIGVDARRC